LIWQTLTKSIRIAIGGAGSIGLKLRDERLSAASLLPMSAFARIFAQYLQVRVASQLLEEGKAVRDIARTFNVHEATIYRLAAAL
jgi:hypothetical protein